MIVFLGINVVGHGGDKPRDVRRAAGAAEPLAAFVLARRFQRVGIKKVVAAECNARKNVVVKRPFQHVDVFGVAGHKKHAVVPENVGDGGAGFAVGAGVGQLVGPAEPLVTAFGANSAGDVQLFVHHIFPNPGNGVDVGLVAGERSHVGHTRPHVGGAHRMPDRLGLFNHGELRLVVGLFLSQRVFPANVEEEFG